MRGKKLIIMMLSMFLTIGSTAVSAVKTEQIQKIDNGSQNEDLPDLIVTKIWIETKYRSLDGEWDLYIHTTVKNIGNAAAKSDLYPEHPDWWTAFYVNERKLFDSQWIHILNPGDSKELTCIERDFPVNPFIKCKIRVHADWTDYVVESNNDNNNKTITQPISRSFYKNSLESSQKLMENLFHWFCTIDN